jgi:hypothetical protein
MSANVAKINQGDGRRRLMSDLQGILDAPRRCS